jgi:hypothetical protein
MIVDKVAACPSFGYNSPLKTAWNKGLLPNVKRGLSGQPLTKQNISLDHLVPHCQGGKTTLDNLVLESKGVNNKRGCTPIEKLVTIGMVKDYLKQFEGQYNKYFSVDEYVGGIKKFFANLIDKED